MGHSCDHKQADTIAAKTKAEVLKNLSPGKKKKRKGKK